MTHRLPIAVSPRIVEDADLRADLQRDLGADTLFFICSIEAALGVQIDDARIDDASVGGSVDAVRVNAVRVNEMEPEENEQLSAQLFEEAA